MIGGFNMIVIVMVQYVVMMASSWLSNCGSMMVIVMKIGYNGFNDGYK